MPPNNTAIQNTKGTIVVALGTNDIGTKASFEPKIQRMIDELRRLNPSARVLWVNAYTLKDGYTGVNDALTQQSSALRFGVLDWKKEATTNPAKYPFTPDGIHHEMPGYTAKANWLVSSIGKPTN
jgi:lysophospholipase L1-like esterase